MPEPSRQMIHLVHCHGAWLAWWYDPKDVVVDLGTVGMLETINHFEVNSVLRVNVKLEQEQVKYKKLL